MSDSRKTPVLALATLVVVALAACGERPPTEQTPVAPTAPEAPVAPAAWAASAAPAAQAVQAAMPVHPTILEGAPPMELAKLLQLLVSETAKRALGWDSQISPSIHWTTQGLETEQNAASGERNYVRNGILRIRNSGVVASVLRQQKMELAWTIRLEAHGTPKHGPASVSLSPGVPGEPCFGSSYEGCRFEPPLESLKRAGIRVEEQCARQVGTEGARAYRLTPPDNMPVTMAVMESGGSGGISTWIEIRMTDEAAGDPCNSDERVNASDLAAQSAEGSPDPASDHRHDSGPRSSTPAVPLVSAEEMLKAEVMRRLVADTRACMREGTRVAIAQGASEQETAVDFVVAACGGGLGSFLVGSAGRPQAEARSFVRALAYREVAAFVKR